MGEHFVEMARIKYGEDAAIGWSKIVKPNNRLVKETYISSWNIKSNESFALWKIYTKDKTAIAIKTTVGKIINSLENEKNLTQYIGRIRHHDGVHYSFRGNMFDPVMYKWDYYSFENELRIVTSYDAKNFESLKTHPKGIQLNVDINQLIDEVYLAPNAGEEEFKYINKLLQDNALNRNIMISGIRDKWAN